MKSKKHNFFFFFFIIGISILLAACGGDGGGNSDQSDSTPQQTAYFIDSGVTGLEYSSSSYQGITDNNGGFLFSPGETTTFSYYGLILGSVVTATDSSIFTPLDLFATTDVNNLAVRNTLVFLQSLDSDQIAGNGINLTRFDSSTQPDFSSLDITNANFQGNLLPALTSLSSTLTPVAESDALDHFNNTLITLNAVTFLEGRWITRDAKFGDVGAVYTFVANGNLTVNDFDDCANNETSWSSTEAHARRNCTVVILSMTWVLDGKKLTMTAEGLNDSCTIISSSPYAIEANCVFTGSGLGLELIRFERDITELSNNLVASRYRELEPGNLSYTEQTFNSDLTGSYHYFDENEIITLEDTGNFSWATSASQLSYSGTDGASLAFSGTVDFGEDVNGAWNNTTSILVPDFDDSLVRNFFSYGTAISVYDAINGQCKRLYNFNNIDAGNGGAPTASSPGFLAKIENGGSNPDICDASNGLRLPDGNSPDDYTISISDGGEGAFVIAKPFDGSYREICWPVSYSTTSDAGSISVLACSINGSPFEFEIWRSL